MTIVTAIGLGKYFGAQDVFQDVSLRIEPGDRIGLIGPNGAGKSTLLRIIAGLEEPSTGQIEIKRGLRIGYLPQHAEFAGPQSLYDAMLPAFDELLRQRAMLQELELQMAQPDCAPAIFERYGELQTRFELAGGYSFETRIRQVLSGLGFKESDFEKPLSILSGGQQTRARLARLLLEAPDLLLLDEPTNHLDIAGIEWLEKHLATCEGSLVIVAHDRRFLDKLVTRMWDLAMGRLESYEGNYSRYVELRAERMARRLAEYEAQQKHIAHTEEFIRRYRAGQRAKEARGRLRRLNRLERLERPRELPRIHLNLQTDLRSGDIVLRAEGLRVGYAGPPLVELFECPDLLLLRGERVAIMGPNGSGKTTLVRTLVGELAPLAGEIRWGAQVRIGYLSQVHAGLPLEQTVLDAILETRNLPISKARHFLGRFLFSGDDIYKRIRDLSGGECSRVALAKLTLQGANLLILDEPTNHLDILSQEILEEVLRQFAGTMVLVSHDRQLVDSLATQVWLIQGRRLVTFAGTYSDYLAYVEAAQPLQSKESAARPDRTHYDEERRRERLRQQRQLQREERRRRERASELESMVTALERELRLLEHQLELASMAGQTEQVYRLGRQYEEIQGRLNQLLTEWVELA